jgi:cob(I)alamin adenosyltransferase
MKIYTKKGDEGDTSLIGGTMVPKYHLRIEAYGTVDELNAYIGLIRTFITGPEQHILSKIQDRLFTTGASLASDPEHSKMSTPDLKNEDVELLENEMDRMNESLPELKNFVLPGGHQANSFCHVARCVCRRAERHVVELARHEVVNVLVVKYLNRLSDYLFVLARKISHDLGVEEVPWQPRQNKD